MKINLYSRRLNSLLFCILLNVFFNGNALAEGKKSDVPKEKCNSCKDLIENFLKGMKRTSKGNFGGGNTDWEDRKLGSYLKSETRFEEIIEDICRDKDTVCHKILEEQEDNLLDWFKNKQEKIHTEMLDDICVEKVKFCCRKNTYGPQCKSCPKHDDNVCSGNGHCDGDGFRTGSGKCTCNTGYGGLLCNECGYGYFEIGRTDSSVQCDECHESCANCTSKGEDKCLSCKTGWKLNSETNLCEDINECLVEESPCGAREYCENTRGSYVCYECDPSCKGCKEKGPDKCIGGCAEGYRSVNKLPSDETHCVDVNECDETPNICGEKLKCLNKIGGYECINEKSKKQTAKDVHGEEKAKLTFYRRSLVIGITCLCAVSSYFSRQYHLLLLSIGFGSIVLFVLD